MVQETRLPLFFATVRNNQRLVWWPRSGLAVTVIAALLVDYFFLRPLGSYSEHSAQSLTLGLLLLEGGLLSLLIAALRTARRRTKAHTVAPEPSGLHLFPRRGTPEGSLRGPRRDHPDVVTTHERLEIFAEDYAPGLAQVRDELEELVKLVRRTVAASQRVIASLRSTTLAYFELRSEPGEGASVGAQIPLAVKEEPSHGG